MGKQPDTIEWAIPEPRPGEFVSDIKGIAWQLRALDPQEFYGADEDREWAVPSIRDGTAAYLLDEFCLLSRGTTEQRKRRAVLLAKEWGSPLSLCGVCKRRHIWDRVRPHPRTGRAAELGKSWWNVEEPKAQMWPPGSYLGDKGAWMIREGKEPVDDWLAWANVINALRRVYVANRAGRQGEPDDVALFWPGPPAAGQRLLVGAVVNKWLSATCVSPVLAFPKEPPGAPPVRRIRIGSVLAWLGWVLREEFTAESGAVGACPECGMTFRLRRAGIKSRELCERCYDRQSKRDERSLAPLERGLQAALQSLSESEQRAVLRKDPSAVALYAQRYQALAVEPDGREGHGLAPASVEGVVISNTGETQRLVRPPVQSPTEPEDAAWQPSPEASAALAQWRKSPEGRASIRADRLALPSRIVR